MCAKGACTHQCTRYGFVDFIIYDIIILKFLGGGGGWGTLTGEGKSPSYETLIILKSPILVCISMHCICALHMVSLCCFVPLEHSHGH